jgi:hypothetical protein
MPFSHRGWRIRFLFARHWSRSRPERRLKGNGLFLSDARHLVPDGSGLPCCGLDCLVAFFTEEFLCNLPVNECVLT